MFSLILFIFSISCKKGYFLSFFLFQIFLLYFLSLIFAAHVLRVAATKKQLYIGSFQHKYENFGGLIDPELRRFGMLHLQSVRPPVYGQ